MTSLPGTGMPREPPPQSCTFARILVSRNFVVQVAHCCIRLSVSAKPIPIIRMDVSLAEYTSQGSNRDFVFLWHDGGVDDIARPTNEFDMTACLAGFNETCGLKAALDLAERLRLKPPQPRPRLCGPSEGAKPGAARSATPKLLLDWRGLLLRLRPGWQHQPRGTEKRTNSPRARQ